MALAAQPAGASCRFSEGTLESPRSIAARVLETATVVGFGVVSTRPGLDTRPSQVVQIVHAFKGRPGRYVMDSGYRGNDMYEVTNHTGNLDAEPGEVVFAALVEMPNGFVFSECTQQLMMAAPLPEIITAISELARGARR